MSVKEKLRVWLDTDPFDISLETKRNDFLDAAGIEIFSPEWDAIQPKMDEVYFASRGKFPPSQTTNTLDFVGKKCGASWISASYTCRIESSHYGMKIDGGTKKAVDAQLVKFEKTLEGYSQPAQEQFRKTVQDAVHSNYRDYKSRKEHKRNKDLIRIVTNATILAEDGPPTRIFMKDGSEVPISSYIYPALSRTGNMGWVDPVQNVSYTKSRQGQMELEQNRVTFAAALASGQVKATVAYHTLYKNSAEMQKKGGFGTAEFAKLRDVPESEVESFWRGLTKKQQYAVAGSGVDGAGSRLNDDGSLDPRSAHRRFYQMYPEEYEKRGREVVKAYLSQTSAPGKEAISPWTGLPVLLPGERGENQGVIDHVIPLSKHYPSDTWTGAGGKPWSKDEGLRTIRGGDNARNFVVGESGINNGKSSSEDWDKITTNWGRKVKEYEKRLVQIEKMPTFARIKNKSSLPPRSSTGVYGKSPVKAVKAQTQKTKSALKKTVKAQVKAGKEKTKATAKDTPEQRSAKINALAEMLTKAKKDRNSALISSLEGIIKRFKE